MFLTILQVLTIQISSLCIALISINLTQVKVALSLCLIKHYAMKAHGTMDV
jgi:hypothetical protein